MAAAVYIEPGSRRHHRLVAQPPRNGTVGTLLLWYIIRRQSADSSATEFCAERQFESSYSCGRSRNQNFRRDASQAQADDRDRWQARVVAHLEDVLDARHDRFHYLLRL